MLAAIIEGAVDIVMEALEKNANVNAKEQGSVSYTFYDK